MLVYLLKFSACLAIFMIFYKLFLEKENMHQLKRFYLLAAIFTALSIPLITFTTYMEPVISTVTEFQTFQEFAIQPETVEEPTNYLPTILWSIYGLGVALFGIKFILNLSKIVFKINRNPKHKTQGFTHVLLFDLITPHTFFSFIFMNKDKFETQQIPKEVFIHEEAHAKQKHSVDVLFIELLQIAFWFNPLIYLTKKSIKLNHEFLADQAVLSKGVEPSTYQTLLLTFSSSVSEPNLANAINYSSIKKRFTVMKTHTSKQKIWMRSFLLLPLVALTLYGFSNREILEKEQISIEDKTTIEYQQKATPEEVAEYNKLAKHYNSQTEDNRVIKLKDMRRLKKLYDKLTKEQRANAESLPNFPPPPPPTKESPKVVQMHDLPPPPPIPADATLEQKKKYQKAIDNYKSEKERYTYKHKTKDGKMVDVVVITDGDEMVPPPPPPPAPPAPKSPLDHVIEMAKKGAVFYYEGKSISSDEAIKLLKNNDELNISTKQVDLKEPKVYISKAPIGFKE